MADPLAGTTPVGALGGFAGRMPNQPDRRRAPTGRNEAEQPRAPMAEGATVLARRMIRERVLARTRLLLELGGEHVPEFAEAIATEPVAAFVGRLVSAQNQLGGKRLPGWGGPRVRAALDHALHAGVAETLELLRDGRDQGEGTAVVAEVLAEYGRRLAVLADDRVRS
jgi:hypothetical protein